MNYAEIKKYDIANGPGVRMSLFVSGCDHQCKNCFNQETWDPKYGKEFTDETLKELIKLISPSYITGLTLLGGDPLYPDNVKWVYVIVHTIKEKYPNKTIWMYTGYTYEYICKKISIEQDRLAFSYYYEIMKNVDVLVDGPFIEEEKDLSIKFRGSRNQNLIDIQKSLFDKDNKTCEMKLFKI